MLRLFPAVDPHASKPCGECKAGAAKWVFKKLYKTFYSRLCDKCAAAKVAGGGFVYWQKGKE